MKLIIAISKSLNLHGHTVRKFRYVTEHKLHVWGGNELSVEEFNKVSKAVFHENAALFPFALVVGGKEVTQAPAPADILADENARLKAENASLHAALNPTAVAAPISGPVVAPKPASKAKKAEKS